MIKRQRNKYRQLLNENSNKYCKFFVGQTLSMERYSRLAEYLLTEKPDIFKMVISKEYESRNITIPICIRWMIQD